MKKVLFLSLIVASQCQAGSLWSDDKVANAAMITANSLVVLDCLQTRDIADNPDKFSESGWAENFIGEHPTTGEVNRHCLLSLAVMNATAYLLPDDWAKWFYIGSAVIQADTVIHNYQAGVRLQF